MKRRTTPAARVRTPVEQANITLSLRERDRLDSANAIIGRAPFVLEAIADSESSGGSEVVLPEAVLFVALALRDAADTVEAILAAATDRLNSSSRGAQ
jgi:hypothetical protein